VVPDFLTRFCIRSTTNISALTSLCEPDLKLVYSWHPLLTYPPSIDFDCTDLVLSRNFDWIANDDEVVFKHELNDVIVKLSINTDSHVNIKGKTLLHYDSDPADVEQGSHF